MQAEITKDRNFYRVLRVLPSADISIIERCYWHLANRCHNAASTDLTAGARLNQLNEAMSAIGVLQLQGSTDTPATRRRRTALGNLTGALRHTAYDAWWVLTLVASLALGVALFDHWSGLGDLSDHLADWRRTIILASSATLAGLVTLALLASLGRLHSKGAFEDKDYYAELHLEHHAEPEIVAIAYRYLAQKYSNLAGTDPGSAQDLAEVEEAFAVLGDSERRSTYDALIETHSGRLQATETSPETTTLPSAIKLAADLTSTPQSQASPAAPPAVKPSGTAHMAISIKLSEWRLRKVLTQRELAELAGVTQSTVALIEAGRQSPRPTTVRKLAKGLGVRPEDLFVSPLCPICATGPRSLGSS